ncbi:hypothetical protein J008_04946 [Cryptococcus neoformans]|nr:hypothetical protein C362_04473 [Cryptococcus neoformans var. grubii Bt1]OXG18069.1 hypothetical protein C367_04883 [Cryptococcus neoformans var. grubii Ze90-1]OXH26800.1 hypothetical protein J008_04946 [Cryptococcus neoformans var. grubii]
MAELPLSRIVIDSEPDWLRVKKNVSDAMMEVMETRLATMPGGKDGDAARTMRRELKARLAQIQDRMFEMSKYNLQVNGQNYEDFVQATEGFDEVLDRKIWGLHTEKVDHETRIAERRKKMPESINRLEVDLEMRRTEAEWLPDDLEDENDVKQVEEIPKPHRHDEVRETFQTVASNLSEVVKSAPLQLQRAQRAQTVRDEITSMPL